MKRALLMPKLGLTMTEGAIVEWTVAPGVRFVAGDTLYVVETEKTATEIPADAAGLLVDVAVVVGATVPVGTLLGHWDDGGVSSVADQGDAPADPVTASKPDAAGIVAKEAVRLVEKPNPPAAIGENAAKADHRIIATPLARRLAAARAVDLGAIVGSGPNGRIRAADVEATAAPAPAAPAAHGGLRVPSAAQTTIARRLTAAKRDIPHFYLAIEAEVSRLTALRAELKLAQPAAHYTLNHFIVAAVGRALLEQPASNVVWTDEGILRFATTDVGMAVATERGLVAPVLRDVGSQSLAQVASQAAVAIERARAGRLSSQDVAGGAMTVSNAGMHDVTYMTSIINPGQSLILGVGSVRELFRPDAAGQPALRREMGLVLSADHRVHDAVSALAFLKRVVTHLEQPLGLLLQ